MITMHAVRQRLLPGFIVGGVLAASAIFAPAIALNLTAVACSYGYLGAPTVTGIAPTSGSTFGGTVVVITGCGFTGTTSVHFGANAATGVVINTDSTIHATSPAHAAGPVDVDVTAAAGTSAHVAADMFTYGAAPCTGVTAVVSNSGIITTAPAGTINNVQAVATGCTNPLFEFFVLNPGGSWTIAQPYSARANFNWDTGSPEPAGTYYYSVWVRDASSGGTFNGGSLGTYDAFAPGTAFVLTTTPCTSVTATAAPASPQVQGTPVTITAIAAGCGSPRYEFWIEAPGSTTWQMAQGYSASAQFQWSTGNINGTYHYSVWVRDSSSAGTHTFILSSYDAFFPGSATFTLS